MAHGRFLILDAKIIKKTESNMTQDYHATVHDGKVLI